VLRVQDILNSYAGQADADRAAKVLSDFQAASEAKKLTIENAAK